MHTRLAHIHTMGRCHTPVRHSPTAREPSRLINHMRTRQPASKHPQQLPRLVQPCSNRRTTHNPARPRGKNPQSVDYKACAEVRPIQTPHPFNNAATTAQHTANSRHGSIRKWGCLSNKLSCHGSTHKRGHLSNQLSCHTARLRTQLLTSLRTPSSVNFSP